MPKFKISATAGSKRGTSYVNGTQAQAEAVAGVLLGEKKISKIVGTVGTDTTPPATWEEGLFKLVNEATTSHRFIGLNFIKSGQSSDTIATFLKANFKCPDGTAPTKVVVTSYKKMTA